MGTLQVNTSRVEELEPSVPPPQAQGSGRQPHSEHRRGLLLIGLFKLTKAILSVGLGLGALQLLHHDVASVILRIADTLRIDPENHLVGLLLNKAQLIGAPQLRHFTVITFTYAGICLIEGTGLMLQKRWAEYFTVTLTALALPLELFELYKEFTMPRIILLLVNLLVLAYLIWLLRRQRQREAQAAAS